MNYHDRDWKSQKQGNSHFCTMTGGFWIVRSLFFDMKTLLQGINVKGNQNKQGACALFLLSRSSLFHTVAILGNKLPSVYQEIC